MLAPSDINKPAIRGRNDDDDDDDDDYKTIQNFKKEFIDKGILHKDGSKKFDNIVNKWKQTKDKNIAYKVQKMLVLEKLILENSIYMIFLITI